MTTTYAILGSGMQGTAAAYDLARFAGDARIILADYELERAPLATDRVNRLVGRTACHPAQIDVLDPVALEDFLTDVQVVLSCVPYWMHPRIADVAVRTHTHMCDLGGNTEVTLTSIEKSALAEANGVTHVPDCGLAPGLVNSLGLFLIESFDQVESIRLYCGVLPQHPKPPFNYKLTFNVEGLVTEYDYEAVVLRDGRIAKVDTLAELESVQIDELGEMEAFTTSGGTSTAPYTFEGRIKNYEYKTLRFPGHCERMRIFKDFGLWREDEVEVRGVKVRPKDVFNRVFGEALAKIADTDQCAVRAVGVGIVAGVPKTIQLDLFDRQDASTGFTSMERLTGFSLSIIAQEIASGALPPGCLRYETAMTGHRFVTELAKRGIFVRQSG